jgi:hypothetical protein
VSVALRSSRAWLWSKPFVAPDLGQIVPAIAMAIAFDSVVDSCLIPGSYRANPEVTLHLVTIHCTSAIVVPQIAC